MDSNRSGIHHDGIDIVRAHDGIENLVPNPGLGPAIEAVILNSAVGAKQSSGKLLMLNQCLCLESSTMANPFGEAL